MPTLGEAVVNITAKDKDLQQGLRDAERQTERFSKKAKRSLDKVDQGLTNIGNSAKRIAKIGGISFGALTAAITTSLKATTDHENAMVKLNSAIAGTGKAIDAAGLEEHAEHLQDISMFSNEANIEAMAMLTTFQLTEKEIRNLIPRVQNIASMYGMDLVQAAQQVGRALTMGAGALSRYGITMSEAENEAFNMADQQEKVNLLMEIFDKNTGPAAARMANTLSGRWRQMINVLDDLRKEFGRLFTDDAKNALETIQAILRTVIDRVTGLDDETKEAVKRWILLAGAFTGAVTAGALLVVALTLIGKTIVYTIGLLSLFTSPIFLIIAALGLLAAAWKENWGGIQDITEKTYDEHIKPTVNDIIDKLGEFTDWFKETDAYEIITNWWQEVQDVWQDEDLTLGAKTIRIAGLTVQALTETGRGTVEGVSRLRDTVQGLTTALDQMTFEEGEGWGDTWERLKDLIPEDMKDLVSEIFELGVVLSELLQEGFLLGLDLVDLLLSAINAAVRGVWNHYKQKGIELGQAIEAGIREWLPESVGDFIFGEELLFGEPDEAHGESDFELTEQEKKDIAFMVRHEAGTQSLSGQVAVAEVILNRLQHPDFPDTVKGVLSAEKQFEPFARLFDDDWEAWERARDEAENLSEQMAAVEEALHTNLTSGALYFLK